MMGFMTDDMELLSNSIEENQIDVEAAEVNLATLSCHLFLWCLMGTQAHTRAHTHTYTRATS